MPSADADVFTNFSFIGKFIATPVLSMQDIFIHEKGKEALKNLNIKLTHSKKNAPPVFDLPAKEEEKKQKKEPTKVKKSLIVEKDTSSHKKTRLNITTTILRDRSEERKRKSKSKSKSPASTSKVKESKKEK